MELDGRINSKLKMRFGLGYEDARITSQGATGQQVGSRIYQTPEWTANLGAVYTGRLSNTVKGFSSADYSYTGSSISSNSAPGSNLERRAFGLVNTRVGVSWAQSELSLNVHNLTNCRPNLGDIGYIGYMRWANPPADSVPLPQVATLPPRTIALQYRQTFW